jgi:beta-glucanase (GH16 family)
MITVKDWFIRTWLELKNTIRYVRNITKPSGSAKYKLKFYDDFLVGPYSNKWDDSNNQGLPLYHPANMRQWYDASSITQTADGVLFDATVKPRYFPEIDTTIPNAIGTMRSKDSWKYGIFVFMAKMPAGSYLWPALWLSGRYNWPPEIDLLEGYSDNTIDFHKNKKLQSNVHISTGEGETTNAGARTHRLPNSITEEVIQYKIWWEKDFIKLYYNGYLVRKITDKRILNGMFEDQRIIIGTGTQEGFTVDNLTPMLVHSVAVYQKD